ncbi:MAG: hypothetical protein R3353_06245 [Salegentibacter mishustinae]|nr:hypothetical protein [Salegentibacter mishustinae]
MIGKANVKKDKNNKDMTIQPFKFDNSIIYTEYDVNIKTVLKGQENLSNIEVINYGGTNTDGEIVEWEGIENFNKGEIYLLFLEKIGDNTGLKTDLRSGKYRPIDGPAGTYVIKSKDIQALKKLNEKKTLSLNELTGQDLSLEVEEVQLNIQKEILSHGMDFIINESKKYK